jgi:flavodoxin
MAEGEWSNMMGRKKLIAAMLVVCLVMGITACGNTQNSKSSSLKDATQEENSQTEKKETNSSTQTTEQNTEISNQSSEVGVSTTSVLIAYFSRADNIVFDSDIDAVASASINLNGNEVSGNAALLAQMAETVTGGDVFSIETVDKYPSGYRDTTNQAKTEQNEGARPKLSTHVKNMNNYDTVILIYPNWWGGLPMPVLTFLEEYDFAGKTILPLCTHEGSGLGSTEKEIATACPQATVSTGLAVRGGSAAGAQSDVEKWLKKLEISNSKN